MLALQIQLDVIHVEEVADFYSISEPLFEAILCDDLPEGVHANKNTDGRIAHLLMLTWAIGLELASTV